MWRKYFQLHWYQVWAKSLWLLFHYGQLNDFFFFCFSMSTSILYKLQNVVIKSLVIFCAQQLFLKMSQHAPEIWDYKPRKNTITWLRHFLNIISLNYRWEFVIESVTLFSSCLLLDFHFLRVAFSIGFSHTPCNSHGSYHTRELNLWQRL